MANPTLLLSAAAFTGYSTASASRYFPLGHIGGYVSATDEDAVRSPYVAGTVSRFGVLIVANARTTACTAKVRVNGVDTSISITIPAGSTGWFEDAVNTATLSDGDELSWSFTTSTGSGTVTPTNASAIFEPASGGAYAAYGRSRGSSNTIQYNSTSALYAFMFGVGAAISPNLTETNVNAHNKVVLPGTLKRLRVSVSSNTCTQASVLEVFKNGVGTGITVTVGAGATGLFYDNSHTATFADGDRLSLCRLANASQSGTLSLKCYMIGMQFDDSAFQLCYKVGSQTLVSGTDYYCPIAGGENRSSTLSTMQIKTPLDLKISYLHSYYTISNTTVPPVTGLNVNGSLSALKVTNTSANVEYVNSSDDVTVIDGDLLAFDLGKVTNNYTFGYFNMVADSNTGGEPVDQSLGAGETELTGYSVTWPIFENLGAGSLTFTGNDFATALTLPAGEASLDGQAVSALAGPYMRGGTITLNGYSIVPPNTSIIDQAVNIALGEGDADGCLNQVAAIALGEVSPDPLINQAALIAVGEIYPGARINQAVAIVLCDYAPCVTERCQMWRIERRDGVVHTFTSLDVDVTWRGEVYKSCNSLSPTASESSSEADQVGSIDLSGIISSDDISEADLFGGLYDDCYVEVWLYPYADPTDSPRRLAAGNAGRISQDEKGFSIEVLGPGAKMAQRSLVRKVTANCSWVFGGPECGVDREAMKIEAVTLASYRRDVISADIDGVSDDTFQVAMGTVRYISGANSGYSVEIKDVDFSTGIITLWDALPHLPEYGDTFEILPGCDGTKHACKDIYGNYQKFGGFPDVPGDDQIIKTPNATY